MKKITILTGAGMSAESGIQTFRGADGLWNGHDIMEVASPKGFNNNPELVLDFYNQRRRQVLATTPNEGHFNLVELEKYFDVNIITQNVDDLHERAGSTKVIHLHGELLKARSVNNPNYIFDCNKDISIGDVSADNYQIRPHIVWFGEEVPMIDVAIELVKQADIIIVIGTSMQVYPAAGLIEYSKKDSLKYFIDPNPSINKNILNNLEIIKDVSSSGTRGLLKILKNSI